MWRYQKLSIIFHLYLQKLNFSNKVLLTIMIFRDYIYLFLVSKFQNESKQKMQEQKLHDFQMKMISIQRSYA